MRDIKELLQLMLDNCELFEGGLCRWNHLLHRSGKITWFESGTLQKHICENKPHPLSSLYSLSAFFNPFNRYYWTEGDIKPRIKWLQKQISKL